MNSSASRLRPTIVMTVMGTACSFVRYRTCFKIPIDIRKSTGICNLRIASVPRLNREESQARTRNLLIEAARDEIVKKGFALASVRDIADAAGFSQGAFYSNFSDKEAILLELVQRHQSEERAKIEAALNHADGESAKALAGIEKWATTINSDPGFAVLAIELQLQALRSPSFAQGYNELNRKHRRALGVLERNCLNCSAGNCRPTRWRSQPGSSRWAAAWRCCQRTARRTAAAGFLSPF